MKIIFDDGVIVEVKHNNYTINKLLAFNYNVDLESAFDYHVGDVIKDCIESDKFDSFEKIKAWGKYVMRWFFYALSGWFRIKCSDGQEWEYEVSVPLIHPNLIEFVKNNIAYTFECIDVNDDLDVPCDVKDLLLSLRDLV